jgi:hypothetical protein
MHPMAQVGLEAATNAGSNSSPLSPAVIASLRATGRTVESAFAEAASMILAATSGARQGAQLVDAALASAEAGSAGWLLPIEPLLNVQADQDAWRSPLARVRHRAA